MYCVVSHLFFHCLRRLFHASGNMSSDDQSGIDQSPLPPPPSTDEFQKFIHATPTTVVKNGTHWNPINWWIEESQRVTTTHSISMP
jgi:hypothetical protein